MKQRVLYYRLSFRPESDHGFIRIFLEDGNHKDFGKLSPQEFNAILHVLSKEPIFWDGTWLFTDNELVKEQDWRNTP